MIEIILLAGAISVELEPYAVENPEPDSHSQETNADVYGRETFPVDSPQQQTRYFPTSRYERSR
jgi:hypothetical protein